MPQIHQCLSRQSLSISWSHWRQPKKRDGLFDRRKRTENARGSPKRVRRGTVEGLNIWACLTVQQICRHARKHSLFFIVLYTCIYSIWIKEEILYHPDILTIFVLLKEWGKRWKDSGGGVHRWKAPVESKWGSTVRLSHAIDFGIIFIYKQL